MATQSVATILPEGLWAFLIDVYSDLGYEVGLGIPLSADGFDPATHRGLHGYDFINWEETFQNEAIVTNPGGGNTDVETSVDFKTLIGKSFGQVVALFNAQETWTSGEESMLSDGELFEALVADQGLIIIGTVDPP